MLRGVLKFSQRELVDDTGVVVTGIGFAECSREPAARISQMPAIKTSNSKRYGK
jgi:hypothetical protein